MPDDSKPEAPPDPFGPLHTGSVAVLVMIRAYRATGGTWLETVAATAAAYIAAHVTGGEPQDGQ